MGIFLRVERGIAFLGVIALLLAGCTGSEKEVSMAGANVPEKSDHQHGAGFSPSSSAPPLTPAQALETFRLAPDFEVELVASEPLVVDPVAMTWSEEGHLYVVEMRGFMRDVEGADENEPLGQVVVLFDDDRDGVMDRNVVFADQLVNPRGVAMVEGGVLIAEPPSLFYCPDSDKNYQCDEKIRVGAYGTNKGGTVEHMENGLFYGLDNWLYNAKSDRRLRFENGKLIEGKTLFRGQWGISQDLQGRLYYNHNSNFITADAYPAEYTYDEASGDLPAGLGQSLTDGEEVYPVRKNPGVNRADVAGELRDDQRLRKPTAVSGLTVFRGGQLPDSYVGDVFVTEPAGNVVAQFAIEGDVFNVQAKHQLYKDSEWEKREFLASPDERFRPVDVKTGPDGALYVVDMYRGLIQHKAYLTDYLKQYVLRHKLDKDLGMGRIYRITHRQGNNVDATSSLSSLTGEKLTASLESSNSWQRETAQRLLVQGRDQSAVVALKAMLDKASKRAIPHVLWSLQGMGSLQREDVLAVIDRNDSSLSIQALRAGANTLTAEDILPLLADTSQSLPLKHQAVLSLSPWSGSTSVQLALIELLEKHTGNEFITQAILASIKARETDFLLALLQRVYWKKENDENKVFLKALSKAAYLSAREDLRDGQLLVDPLDRLLQIITDIPSNNVWQSEILLEGVASSVTYRKFTPAMMPAQPDLFAKAAASEGVVRSAGKAFTWPNDDRVSGLEPLTDQQQQLMIKGEEFYSNCANCHGVDGKGVAGLAPTLSASDWVTGPVEWLGRIILQGVTGPIEVNGEVWDGSMPGHANYPGLDDGVFAGLMTYMRRSWGNTGRVVDLEDAIAVRQVSKDRNTPWTVAELKNIPFRSPFESYLGIYKVSFMQLELSDKGGKLLATPSRGEPTFMRHVYDQLFFGSDEGFKLDFELGEDGKVVGVKVDMGESSIFMPKVN